MKVLMIAPQPFFEPRGTPISVYQRLTALSQLGYETDLVTYHVGESPAIAHVTIHRSWPIPFVKQIKIGPSWLKPFLDVLVFFKALSLLLRKRYDVIHSHEEAAFLALILAPIFGVKHLYDMHSSLPYQLKSYGVGDWWPLINIFSWLERLVINSCDALITIDASLAEIAKTINPYVNQLNIENIHIDTDFYLSDQNNASITAAQIRENFELEGKTVIVYTGTFERYQGLDLVIHSIEQVKHQHSQVNYILVGGKPHQIQQLQELAEQLALNNWVQFTGIVSPEDALVYLQAADILISSRTEGTSVPLKVYSYLHAGKPIVATNLTAHTQVFSDDTALLVEPSVDGLAAGVLTLIADPTKMAQLGQQAHSFALEHYTMDNYIKKMRHIYQTLQPVSAVSKEPLSSIN